jgi:hypothetical protein
MDTATVVAGDTLSWACRRQGQSISRRAGQRISPVAAGCTAICAHNPVSRAISSPDTNERRRGQSSHPSVTIGVQSAARSRERIMTIVWWILSFGIGERVLTRSSAGHFMRCAAGACGVGGPVQGVDAAGAELRGAGRDVGVLRAAGHGVRRGGLAGAQGAAAAAAGLAHRGAVAAVRLPAAVWRR